MGSLSEQELLALSDQDLFRGGGCHVFADELYQRLASEGFVLRRIAEGEHPRRRAHHVYVAKGDTAVDCQGIRTESGMLAERVEFRRKNNYPLTEYKAFPCEQKTLFEVCNNLDEPGPHNCWYHRIGDHFVQECRRLARAMGGQKARSGAIVTTTAAMRSEEVFIRPQRFYRSIRVLGSKKSLDQVRDVTRHLHVSLHSASRCSEGG